MGGSFPRRACRLAVALGLGALAAACTGGGGSAYSSSDCDSGVCDSGGSPAFEELSFFEEALVGRWSRYHSYDDTYDYLFFNDDRTACFFEIDGSSMKDEVEYRYWRLDEENPVGNNEFIIYYMSGSSDSEYEKNDEFHYNEDVIWYGGYSNLEMSRSTTSRSCADID